MTVPSSLVVMVPEKSQQQDQPACLLQVTLCPICSAATGQLPQRKLYFEVGSLTIPVLVEKGKRLPELSDLLIIQLCSLHHAAKCAGRKKQSL